MGPARGRGIDHFRVTDSRRNLSDRRQNEGTRCANRYDRHPMNADARERFYLSTAIFYPTESVALHSLFEAVGADAIVRYQRMLGKDVRFLTGMDEHSANVEKKAIERGVQPRDLVDPWAATWKQSFDKFGISYDRFIRTTDPDHARASTDMVTRAMAADTRLSCARASASASPPIA